MSPRVRRLTNFYYAEYSPQSDPSILWDSDGSVAKYKIANSPKHREWCDYSSQRAGEEKKYKKWKTTKMGNEQLMAQIREKCGWKVKMFESKVWYTYKPRMDDRVIENLSFKMKFEYVRFLRSWYLSRGSSFVPDFLALPNFKRVTYDPTGPSVVKFLRETRKVIDSWIVKRVYYSSFEEIIQRRYSDPKICFDLKYERVKFLLCVREGTWLPGHPITTEYDALLVRMMLNDDCCGITESIRYSYTHSVRLRKSKLQRLEESLKKRLGVFARLPFLDAFEEFMAEPAPSDLLTSSSDEDLDTSSTENSLEKSLNP